MEYSVRIRIFELYQVRVAYVGWVPYAYWNNGILGQWVVERDNDSWGNSDIYEHA